MRKTWRRMTLQIPDSTAHSPLPSLVKEERSSIKKFPRCCLLKMVNPDVKTISVVTELLHDGFQTVFAELSLEKLLREFYTILYTLWKRQSFISTSNLSSFHWPYNTLQQNRKADKQRNGYLQNIKKNNFNEHKYHTNHDKQNVQYAQVPWIEHSMLEG